MCPRRCAAIVGGVSGTTKITVTLELCVTGDCLTGTATNGDGEPRQFSGWLGLVAALDGLVPDRSDPATPTPWRKAMTAIDTTIGDVRLLRSRMRGDVIAPDEDRWDLARQAYNLTIDQRPELVAFPLDVDDVVEIVRFARARGFRVAPQRTGHNAAPLGPLENTILLKTDDLDTVEIDASALRARVGAGVKWESVVPRLSELGLAALHGSTPDVSIAGYGLGGGVGWYGRKHGLFTNSITAIELVTADGRLRRVDHEHEPELFWALRGGGGNFGVVTALEFRLFPISEVYAGALFFPWERSAEVLRAWREWTETVPDEVTSVGRILQFPPLDLVPELFRGKAFVIVHAYFVGSEADGAELVAPLRALGPVLDTVAMVPPVALSEMHMDLPDPVPYQGDHLVLGGLPAAAIDAFVAAAGPGSGSTVISAEIRHAGGALGRGGDGHGALDRLPGEFLYFGVGMVADEASAAILNDDLHRIADSLRPYRSGSYLNFEEGAVDTAAFYPEATYDRLRALKAQYDPEDLFRANHPIPPAS
jgi:FAD/FMN-containing dehydrogenase